MDDALDDAAMSAIKEFLASQRADFISLHDLLEAMTKQGKGCSLQEAADFLRNILDKEGLDLWVTYSPSTGIREEHDYQGVSFNPWRLLDYVSRNGNLEADPDAIPF